MVFDATDRWTGQLREFLYLMNEFIERLLGDDARGGMEWLLPLIEQQNRGFPGRERDLRPAVRADPQAPCIVRRDHFEQAGIDFDENFPIRDTDHFIELCKEIQGKAGIQFPTEVYGKIWDFGDTQLNGWIRSLSLADSNFITDDWSQSNATTDAWIGACSSMSTSSRSSS